MPAVHDAADTDERFLEAVYWLVLGRPVDDEWRKTRTRQFELGQPRDAVLRAALGSSEFRQRHQRFHHRVDPDVVVPDYNTFYLTPGTYSTRTREQAGRDVEIERQYRAVVDTRIPDKKASGDPWKSVRRAPAAAAPVADRHKSQW